MTTIPPVTRRIHRTEALPAYIHHPSFDLPGAGQAHTPPVAGETVAEYETRYMPDEVTRDHAKRMHYAAARMHSAHRRADRQRWRSAYLDLRDRIVLGNRKLIYLAVRRRSDNHHHTDDMIGDCHVVLIQAVAAFNPWLNIRFSTYAYTCLVRALARKGRRTAADRLGRALSLDALPDGEPHGRFDPPPLASSGTHSLDVFLRDDHPLLSPREKTVLARRFSLTESGDVPTLEAVGRDVGLSKERVRQVQAAAIGKLRKALNAASV